MLHTYQSNILFLVISIYKEIRRNGTPGATTTTTTPPLPPTHTRENDTQTGASTSFKVLDKVSRQPLKRPPATSRPVLSSTRVYFKGLKSHLIFDTTLPGHRVQFSSISVFTECPDDKYLYTCSKALTPFKAKIGYRNIRDAHECL